jgi:hypothetical protein
MATALRPDAAPGDRPLVVSRGTAAPLPDPAANPALRALLGSTHAVYRANVHDWLVAERRLFGGAPALSELQPFVGESAADYAIRQRKATYVPFPKLQAAAQTGHLLRQMPVPNYGTLGQPRERGAAAEGDGGAPTLGELIHYNCDGVGADGTQWPAWWARVTEAIHGPGFGWIYVEAPDLGAVRRRRPTAPASDGVVDLDDVRAGLRPYLVHFTPGQVPNWHAAHGRLEWAVVRPPVRAPGFRDDGAGNPAAFVGNDGGTGYLLLVRRGWDAFGAEFRGGGWWTFDPEMRPLARGDWSRTGGEIPLFVYAYERSEGLIPPAGGAGVTLPRTADDLGIERPVAGVIETGGATGLAGLDGDAQHRPAVAYPAIARSGTLELGNVAVALMDALSERDFDAREAAASGLTVAGVDRNAGRDKDGRLIQNNFNDYAGAARFRARLRPLPYSVVDTGFDNNNRPTREVVVPTVTDDSMGAVPAEVYEKLVASKFAEARELMARELTSAPDSSGASKAAGFAEGKSPRLALLAANCETAQNTALYFLERRAGAARPTGFVTLPREYDLAPLLETIDRALQRLRDAGLTSPTLAVALVLQALDEDGLLAEMTDAERQAVEDELTASATAGPARTRLEELLTGPLPEDGTTADDATATDTTGRAASEADDGLPGARPPAPPPSRPAPPATDDAGDDDDRDDRDDRDPPPPAAAPAAAPPALDVAALAAAVAAALAPRLDAIERRVGALEAPPPAPPAPPTIPPAQVITLPAARSLPSRITLERDGAGNLTGVVMAPASE